MTATRRKTRTKKPHIRLNTRRKVPSLKPISFRRKWILWCRGIGCMVEEPVLCAPDEYYKEDAEDLLIKLHDKMMNHLLTEDAYTYMVLGYGSVIKSKYKRAIVYFNQALASL